MLQVAVSTSRNIVAVVVVDVVVVDVVVMDVAKLLQTSVKVM